MMINKYTIEELEEGMSFTITREITESVISDFAQLTGDHHPLHTNKEYAIANGFENIMAHGQLITSFSSTLIGMKLPGENAIIMSQSFKYKRPAYAGTLLNIKGVVTSVDLRFSFIIVKIIVTNGEENIAEGKYTVQIRK